MTNKHIELVKKWLVDNDSVSRDELVMNANAAYDADYTEAAYSAAYSATYSADADAAAETAYGADASLWVKRFEELTK